MLSYLHNKHSVTLVITLLACMAVACDSKRNESKATNEFLYVFSKAGQFGRVERNGLFVVETGTLRSLGIYQIDGIITDPDHRDLLVKTSGAWSADAGGPRPAIDILRLTRSGEGKASIRLIQTVRPPPAIDQFLGGIIVNTKPRILVFSWSGPGETKRRELTTLFSENEHLYDQRTVDQFALYPGACVSSSGSVLYSLRIAAPLQIRSLQIQTLDVTDLPVRSSELGNFEPLLIAGSSGCRIFIIGRPEGKTMSEVTDSENVNVIGFIYDVEHRRVLGKLDLKGLADYYISPDGQVLTIDKKIIVPNILPSGQTVGVKYKKVGLLRIFSAETVSQMTVVRLPEDGKLSIIEGNSAYYLSPGMLTALDVRSGAVRGRAELPFTPNFAAILNEEILTSLPIPVHRHYVDPILTFVVAAAILVAVVILLKMVSRRRKAR